MMNTLWRDLAEFWCKSMHPDPMWPAHGRYRCRKCLREYPVPWEDCPPMATLAPAAGKAFAAAAVSIKDSNAQPARSWRRAAA